ELLLCHGMVCVVGRMRDLILQLSKSSIYSTKPPATGVVTDKGVPQSDSFAKYATVDSIGQRNSYVKTWGCGGFLNETNIYSRGKSLCF
ncbi:hypothetical protein KVP79_23670, partial [Escherichia coli]|nr:hypothetical protein [Escherichia coli]MCH0638886.1 hypothetical protein [Escherichia coli]